MTSGFALLAFSRSNLGSSMSPKYKGATIKSAWTGCRKCRVIYVAVSIEWSRRFTRCPIAPPPSAGPRTRNRLKVRQRLKPRIRLTRLRRISPANIGPNLFHQCRAVSWKMSMPHSNKRSFTFRSDNGSRTYMRTQADHLGRRVEISRMEYRFGAVHYPRLSRPRSDPSRPGYGRGNVGPAEFVL